MPRIGNPIPSSEMPCDRCGSKRKVSKTWTEKIQTANGTTVLHHTQIICTNKECQAKFDKIFADESQKREKLKQTKLENATKRVNAKPLS